MRLGQSTEHGVVRLVDPECEDHELSAEGGGDLVPAFWFGDGSCFKKGVDTGALEPEYEVEGLWFGEDFADVDTEFGVEGWVGAEEVGVGDTAPEGDECFAAEDGVDFVEEQVPLGLHLRGDLQLGAECGGLAGVGEPFAVVIGFGVDEFPGIAAEVGDLFEVLECAEHSFAVNDFEVDAVDEGDEVGCILEGETGIAGLFLEEEQIGRFGSGKEQMSGAFEEVCPVVGEEDFAEGGHDVAVSAEPENVAVIEADLEAVFIILILAISHQSIDDFEDGFFGSGGVVGIQVDADGGEVECEFVAGGFDFGECGFGGVDAVEEVANERAEFFDGELIWGGVGGEWESEEWDGEAAGVHESVLILGAAEFFDGLKHLDDSEAKIDLRGIGVGLLEFLLEALCGFGEFAGGEEFGEVGLLGVK